MPAPQSYHDDNIDPFAADASSVYAYPFIQVPTISPTDYQLSNPKTFFTVMENPFDDPPTPYHQMHRSKSSRSRTRDGWAHSSSSRSAPVSSLSNDAPLRDHQSYPRTPTRSSKRTSITRRQPLSPPPTSPTPSRPSSSIRGSPPSPPSPSKLRSALTPTPSRPAPAPPLFTRSRSTSSLLLPPFMVPSTPSTPQRPAPPKRSTSYSPRRKSPDLYKQVLQTCFTMSPAGQKTREMGARMASRLWNANLELERLVKIHSDALAAFELERDSEEAEAEVEGEVETESDSSESSDEDHWELERPSTPSSTSSSPPSDLYPPPLVFDSEQDISSSVTEAILADMEGLSLKARSTEPLSFLDDEWECLDPFMQLPHPTARSPVVACY